MTIKLKYTDKLLVIEFENNEERDKIIDIFYLQRITEINNIIIFKERDYKIFNDSRYPDFKVKVKKVK
jgi:tyrosine-protein phosphatase YwqE